MQQEDETVESQKSLEIFDFKWVKDNLSVITLVPLILGGIWQIIVLASMSISYIRFFSITQQVSDGLLILITFSIIFYSIRLVSRFFATEAMFDFDLQGKNYKFLFLLLALNIIVCTSFSIASFFFFSKVFNNNNIDLIQIIISLGLIIAVIIPLLRIIINLYVLITKLLKLERVVINNILENKITKRVLIVGIIAVFILIRVILVKLHEKYVVPDNLINTKKILNNYISEQKNPKKDSIQIVYFNDKFIFIQNKKDIEILKFDNLFEEKKK